jgi:diguanylate cyclase
MRVIVRATVVQTPAPWKGDGSASPGGPCDETSVARPVARRVGDADPPESANANRTRDLRIVARIHRLRTLGLGLGFLCVASVLHVRGAPAWLWLLLVLDAFAWPHVARAIAQRSRDPLRAEFRNLVADSAFGGAWIAVMHFCALPSALLLAMLSVDKMSAGGWRLLGRATVALAASCLVVGAMTGFAFAPQTPMTVVYACLPFLVAYPLAVSTVTFALAVKVGRRNRQLAELARTDELTGLANRRHCVVTAQLALEAHRASGRPAVLVVIDVDGFKHVNDRWGHPVGDRLLRGVTGILQSCTRASDLVARYAGDEFMIVMHDTDLRGGGIAAERIRTALRKLAVEGAADLRCTVSLGAAEAHREMADVEDWIQQADAALYRAKAAGRNRFVAAPSAYRDDSRLASAPGD